MSVLTLEKISIADYLEQEFTAEGRHEYNNGKITEMSYASENHESIVGNIVRELGNFFRDIDFRVYPSNRMLHTPDTGSFYYADAMIVKGEPQVFHYKKKMRATLNPVALVEVLSDSTEAKDRGEKWRAYRTIPSLEEYVLIAQDQIYVEVFRKKDGIWQNEAFDQTHESINIAGQDLLMSEIYRDTSL